MRVPLIARNVFDSIRILTSACQLLAEKCVDGIEANEEALRRHAESTPAIATALNPHIGYDQGTEIVKEAVASERTIREVAIEKGVDEETLDKALDLRAMARGSRRAADRSAAALAAAGRCARAESGPARRALGAAALAHSSVLVSRVLAAPAAATAQQIGHRVDRRVVAPHLEVQMGAGRVAGRAHAADLACRPPRSARRAVVMLERCAYQVVKPSRCWTTTRFP